MNMELHPVDLVISLINIAVLFILLRLILWKHVYRYLSERAKRVRMELDDAEDMRLNAQTLKQEYEEKIEKIETQGRDMIRESQIKATEASDEILEEAHEKAGALIAEARAIIEDDKQKAILEAHHDIAQLATDMAARILKREVSPDDSKYAVEQFFSDTQQ
jgi:F-type H+-transporting ATPase subunit b